MFKIRSSREINECLYKGKKHKRIYKEHLAIDDYIIETFQKKKYLTDFKKDIIKQRKFELEEYGEVKEEDLKKERLILNMGTNKLIVRDSFDKLSNNESIFFWLYNTTNYYDERFGGYTYLDEVLCYLIAYIRDKADKFGTFTKRKVKDKDAEDFNLDKKVDDIMSDGIQKYDNFAFKDYKSYMNVKRNAEKTLRLPSIMEATKEVVKKSIEDPEYARASLVQKVQDIAKNSESDKVRLEAYKVLGNWLGIDKPIVQNNINVVMSGIENDLQRQGFDFDVSDFKIVEGTSDE